MYSDPMDNKEQTIVKITLGDLLAEFLDADDTEIGITCDITHNSVTCIDSEIVIKLSGNDVKKISDFLTRRKHENDLAHIIDEIL